MKRSLQITAIVFSISLFSIACRKSAAPTPADTLPPVISQGEMDSLKKDGTVFNPGTTPPVVSGQFFLDPSIILYDNSGLNLAGMTADSYVFKFSNQNNSTLTLDIAYRDVSNLEDNDSGADSSATYISGSGELFSIYARINGSISGVKFSSLQVISGKVTSGGIADMQVTNQLLSKDDDAGNDLIFPVGTVTIEYDGDKLSVPYPGVITFNVSKTTTSQARYGMFAKTPLR